MQSGDSIKAINPIGKPLEIKTGGDNGMVLPKIEIAEIKIETPTAGNETLISKKRQTTHGEGVILTSDSINYSIIPPKKESFSYPSFTKSNEDTTAFSLFNSNTKASSEPLSFNSKYDLAGKDSVEVQTHASVERSGFNGIKPNLKIQQDSSFIFVVICFALIAYAIKTEGDKISRKIKHIFSNSAVNREQTTMPMIAGLCLTIQTILIFGLFLHNILSVELSPLQPKSPALSILIISLIISLFIWLKLKTYRILGLVFTNTNRILNMRRKYIAAVQLFGAFSFLPILLYIYSDGLDIVFLILICIFFLFERLIAIYHVVYNFLQEKINFLFLIVYLCTIEILPYFIFYEIITLVFKLDLTSILWH